MWDKVKALGKIAKSLGSTAKYGRVKAKRDQALLDLAELQKQREMLEEHYRESYSQQEYENSRKRIEAEEKRLMARIDRYTAQLEEIEASVDRTASELESINDRLDR